MEIEKIKEFLYDLDKIRSDADAVNKLILNYNGISESSESKGIHVMLELGDIDGEDLKFHLTVDGESDSMWFNVNEDDATLERLALKNGEVLLDIKI